MCVRERERFSVNRGREREREREKERERERKRERERERVVSGAGRRGDSPPLRWRALPARERERISVGECVHEW